MYILRLLLLAVLFTLGMPTISTAQWSLDNHTWRYGLKSGCVCQLTEYAHIDRVMFVTEDTLRVVGTEKHYLAAYIPSAAVEHPSLFFQLYVTHTHTSHDDIVIAEVTSTSTDTALFGKRCATSTAGLPASLAYSLTQLH